MVSGSSAKESKPTTGPGLRSRDPAQDPELNILAIQQTTSGKIVMESISKGKLLLSGVSRHTIWFSDKPSRYAEQVNHLSFKAHET